MRAACGLLGPAIFTAAWLAATARQKGYSVAVEHISGLAAPDASAPQVMTAGFLGLGAAALCFAGALQEALGGRRRAGTAPDLVRVAGLGTLAAGALRRDRMLLDAPGAAEPPTWRNHGHDLASGVAYAAVTAAPAALWWRTRRDPEWSGLAGAALGTCLATAALLGLFASRVAEPWNGVVQRVAVSIPNAAAAGLAVRLLTRPAAQAP